MNLSLQLLEEFSAYITWIDGDTCYITIHSLWNGDELYGKYPKQEFEKYGPVEEDNQYILRTARIGGEVSIMIGKFPSRGLTAEEVAAIKKKIEEQLPRWTDDLI